MSARPYWLMILAPLFIGAMLAQNSDRPAHPTRDERPAQVTAPAATSVARTRVTVPTSLSSIHGSQGPAIPVISTPSGHGPIPVQAYGRDMDISVGDWYRCNYFVERLMRDYRFAHGYDYLWRYAQGDSPLTPETLALALKSSSSASRDLNLHANHLNHLIASYKRGEIGRATFNQEVRTTTRQIRDSAKRIRNDFYLGYLDLGSKVDVPDYDEPMSLTELQELAAQLLEAAQSIDGTLTGFFHRDLSRVVSVKDLQSPSTESRSRQIDQLAKLIERSSTRL
ncbi:MAG: hypothetical protein P8Y94_02460 [Acidobacteriota bacterium]